jgi:amino acid adenylation domain-containing protein
MAVRAAYHESRKSGAVAAKESDAMYRLFADIASSQPDASALRDARGDIAYGALYRRAEQMSAWLLKAGARHGDRIVFVCHRSAAAIAAHLAALRIGAVCVPLDPSSPAPLIEDQIAQAAPSIILYDGLRETQGLPLHEALAQSEMFGDEAPQLNETIVAHDPAFIMFTSGSTGRSKGVIVPHRAIVRLVRNQDYGAFGRETVFLHASAPSFDASLLEVWAPLLNGGICAILETPRPSLDDLAEAIEVMKVREAWLTSGVFNLMVDHRASALSRLGLLISGGDVLSVAHVRRALEALPQTRLVNGYGPTENTTFTTCHVFSRDRWGEGPAPIGLPLNGTHVHILDDNMLPVADGDVGRLWVGGAGVALGYLDQPELTRTKFHSDPSSEDPNALIYDTGDLASMRCDGALMFHGRVDRQVKLNGVRIELDGIESIIADAPGVRAAAVVARTGANGDKHLEAYVVLNEDGNLDRVRVALHDRLPAAMVPGVVASLPHLPLTPQGKVDRAALRVDEAQTARSIAKSDAAHSVARIWSNVLGREILSANESFFSLGGTSLQMLRVHVLLEEAYGRMPLAALFDHATIEAQARYIKSMSREDVAPSNDRHQRAAFAREARARIQARREETPR